MKRLTIILILFCATAKAQFSENHSLYGTFGIYAGNALGTDVNLNYILKEEYSFKLGYSIFRKEAEQKPANYSMGVFDVFMFGMTNPYDVLQNFQFQAGRVIALNPKGSIRLNISAGLAYSKISRATDFDYHGGAIIGGNYDFKHKTRDAISLIVNPKIEFPFTKVYGLSLSPLLVYNNEFNYIGIGIEHMIGVLRKWEHKK